MTKGISFRAQLSGGFRTNILFGKDHLVVPVVALVEGVLQAMNAATPELALSSEFGKFPASWNGRPVVMNHPIINNQPVSANIPTVLETYAFGHLFNTVLEDGKLKTEAWIDLDRVNALGGEVASTIARIQAGEIVEVSTGLFTDVDETTGTFDGKTYDAVWRGVVPDHLAFLSAGAIGACSVEAGCGTRVNAAPSWTEYSMTTESKVKTNETTTTTTTEPHVHSDCGCSGAGDCGKNAARLNAADDTTTTEHTFSFERFIVNAMPATMLDTDARKLVSDAIKAKFSGYSYVVGLMTDKVIFERWDNFSDRYGTYQINYSISDTQQVTLGEFSEEVILTTQVTVKANKESEMTTTTEPKAPTPAATTTTPAVQEPVINSAVAPAPAAPRTLAEHMSAMPEEMREMLESGLRLHAAQKQGIIKALKDTGRCKFSDDQLGKMGLDQLQSLAELAAVPSFEAVATPRTNASADDGKAPTAPTL